MPEVMSPRAFDSNVTGIPLDQDILFSDHLNNYKKGIEKRQTKLLKKIDFLKPFLKDDETVLLVTTGCSPMSVLEQFLMGWIVFYMKRSLFVFTNKRVFHIPTKPNYKYRHSLAGIPYANCRTIEMKGRTLVVTYQKGKQEKFYYMARAERKKIASLLKILPLKEVRGRLTEKVHLCPQCTNELIADNPICPNCRLEFKNKNEGKKISILYPGGGYFYTRHWWLGIGDAFTEVLLLLLVIVSLVDAVSGSEGGLFGFFFFLLVLMMEKAISVYHSDHFIKEFIPVKKDIVVSAASSG